MKPIKPELRRTGTPRRAPVHSATWTFSNTWVGLRTRTFMKKRYRNCGRTDTGTGIEL